MNKQKVILVALGLLLMLGACHRIPFTHRKQVKMLPNSTMNSMSFQSYKDFLGQNQLSTKTNDVNMVKRVGKNIQNATEKYYKAKGIEKKLKGFAWEFNLVEDPTVNAWCMPGGKVVIYSGILPVTQNEDGLAVVMGHEIAHALAHHGNERMSQGLATQMGGVALSVALSTKSQETQNMFLNAYGVGTQVGALLPFSRLHESEADEIGLYLMAMAGYNPEEAAPFWQRMNSSGGQRPPEFLSTHPDPAKRSQKLKEKVPAAKAYGKKYGTK